MNYPSVKTLMQITGDRETAKIARAIIDGSVHGYSIPGVREHFSRNYHPQSKLQTKMEALNRILGGYGVEAIQIAGEITNSKWLDYVNMGDTYAATILHYNGRFVVGDWGSVVERLGL